MNHNFDRLEKRFKERYRLSLDKKTGREQTSKPVHQTNLKSIEENKKRLLMVRMLRYLLLDEALNLEL
ncbi:MAG: hypothetical protein ACKV1O_16130 [Saprospiraceae bacterium]